MGSHVVTLDGHHIVAHVEHLGIGHVGVLIAIDEVAIPTLRVDVGLGLAIVLQVSSILLSLLDTNLILDTILLSQQVVMHLAVG